MGWWTDLQQSATWRKRRDHIVALATSNDGAISLADTMPDTLDAQAGDGRGFPTYLPVRRAIDAGAHVDEFGVSGTENIGGYIYNEEYNPKLSGKAAISVYDQMRRSDAQVHATTDMVKLPLRSADIVIEAASDDPEDQRIADFCAEKILGDDALHDPFDATLRHVLLSEDFGTSALEKVYEVGDNGEIGLHRLAPRLPKTFERFDVDANGKLTQLVQYGPKLGKYDYWTIPADLVAVFPREKEGDNFWGMSILRTAYKHWYYKNEIEHIDMIAHDKYGVGTPHAKLLQGFPIGRPGELQRLENALMGIRSGSRNFLITSDKVSIEILVATANGGRSVKESLDYHNIMIARNVLANHLALGDQPHGTYNLGIAFMDLFLYALQARAADIAGVFKRQIIKQLCDLNFQMENRDYPSLRFQNLTNFDIQKLGAAFAPLVTSKVITVTDDVEDMFRQLFDLPPLPAELRRENGVIPEGIDFRRAIAGDENEKRKALAALGATPPAAPGAPQPTPAPAPQPQPIAASDAIRLTDDMIEAVREELRQQRIAEPTLTPPPPLHVHIVTPSGKIVRTTSTEILRDKRGLITGKRDRVEETPDDSEGD